MASKGLKASVAGIIAGLPVGAADAQSTATQREEVERDIVVTGTRAAEGTGLIAAERAPKQRATITSEVLARQTPGQSAFQSLSLLAGVNFTNSDPYGSSGGNIRIHGLDATRLSVTLDGVQLNSSPSNLVFSSDLIDPELIEQINVNLGSTDIDSASPNAVGGTINIVTVIPDRRPRVMLQPSAGTFDYRRLFARIDTGELASSGTRAFVAASAQAYDKFRGAGEMDKRELNARLYQPLAGENFLSLAGRYLRTRNYFYRALTLSEYRDFGPEYDFSEDYLAPSIRSGAADIDPAANADYFALRRNPSNTGSLRGQSRFTIAPGLLLTADPSFAFTRGAGGFTVTIRENDGRLRGSSAVAGLDLNGDGDILDTVRVYTSSYARTERYSLTSSLVYDLSPAQTIRIAYTGDHNRALQRSPATLIRDGEPLHPYGGVPGYAPPILTADGSTLRTRDRFSEASLHQAAGEYRGTFLRERLNVVAGLRAPFFTRKFRQYCYSSVGTGELCTTQTAGLSSFLPPYRRSIDYDALLPSLGVSFRPDQRHQLYASYSTGFSPAPPVTLYVVARTTPPTEPGQDLPEDYFVPIDPEKSSTYSFGYRFRSDRFLASAAFWRTDFEDRIATAFDPETNLNVSRNVGDVRYWGVDAEFEARLARGFGIYGSVAYAKSRVAEDVRIGPDTFLPTRGREAVDLPRWTVAARAQYKLDGMTAGMQAKFVDDRFSTDINDEVAPSYLTVDLDLRYELRLFGDATSFIQLNVQNLFDEDYLATINSVRTAANNPTYFVGPPRTVSATLRVAF